jgi:hypothetical protein
MKELLRKALGCPMALALVLAGVGCTDEESGLFIQGNMALTPPNCEARAEGSSPLLISGVLDVGLKLDYEATLLVGSQLTPRTDKVNLRTETMIAVVTGAEVHLFTDTGEEQTAFTVPASGVIRPDPSDDPGFGVISATLIPQQTGSDLSDEMQRGEVRTRVAEVKVFGQTVGGLDVESAALRYVIRVCKGCLVAFPPAALSATGQCNKQQDQNPQLPCQFGQDAVVDCRSCAANNEICQTAG